MENHTKLVLYMPVVIYLGIKVYCLDNWWWAIQHRMQFCWQKMTKSSLILLEHFGLVRLHQGQPFLLTFPFWKLSTKKTMHLWSWILTLHNKWPRHSWSSTLNHLQTKYLMICVLIYLVAITSKWISKNFLYFNQCKKNSSNEHTIKWVQAPFRNATTTMNADSYSYVGRNSLLVPEFVILKPNNLPDPCTCSKCHTRMGVDAA